MEILIVICLLAVIALLVEDKILVYKRKKKKLAKEKLNPNLPDIMGQPKQIKSLSAPNTVNENQKIELEYKRDNFDIEIVEKGINLQIPQEELDNVFSNMPDFEEEEEEWSGYGISRGDNGFAQGVTFEELSSVGMLLQKDKLEPSQKETTIAIVQKIHGTELFSLLENSIEGASQKIAEFLDSNLFSESDDSSSILRESDFRDFDIGEFV